MSEMGGVDAGPLYVDVVADTTGFGRDLQAKLNVETARVKATIQAQVDARKAEADLARVTAKQRVATIRGQADVTRAEAELEAAAGKKLVATIKAEANIAKAESDLAKIAAADRVAQIKVEVETASAEFKLDQIAAKRRTLTIEAAVEDAKAEAELERIASKRRVASIQAEADTLNAERKLDEAARDRTAKISIDTSDLDKVGSQLQGFGSGALGLLQFPAIAAGISMAAGALAQVAAGLFSVVAAAAPAVGILGAIPGAVAGAAQGIGTVIAGFAGIGAALKSSDAAQKSSGATAGATAAQHAAAAARIVAAQDRIKQAVASEANAEANAARAIQQAQQGVANAHAEAARSIQSAQRGLATAQTESARQIQTAEQAVITAHQEAARQVAQAEQQLAQSQRDATQAQLDLIQAREQATRQLQDMNNNLTDQSFSVEEAQIGVQRADINRTKVNQNPKSTALDKQQADLDYREAVQRLKEQQQLQQRLASDTAKANKAGVEGSDLVTRAKQRVLDANAKVRQSEIAIQTARSQGAANIAKAERALQAERIQGAQRIGAAEQALQDARTQGAQKIAAAEANLANTRRTSAFSVASAQGAVLAAQRDLTAAQAAGTTATTQQSAAAKNLQTALDGLSPAGRKFVNFLSSTLIPAWTAVQNATQNALLPPVQRGLTALLPLLGILQSGMVRTATIVGGAFERLATQYLATPLFKRDLATVMATNNRAFAILATALTPVVRALTDLTVASGPLLLRFAQFVATGAQMASAFISAQRASGGLARFFQQAGDSAAQLWRIVRDLVAAVLNIGKAAMPAGRTLLASFEGVVAQFRAWTASMQGQNTLRDYFTRSIPIVQALGRLLRDIVIDFFKLGNNDSFAGLVDMIRTQALPAILRLGQTLNGAFGPALVRTITDVVNLIADLADSGGGGGLVVFVNTLDRIVRLFDAIARNPVGNAILSYAASALAAAAAFSFVFGPVVRLAGVFARFGGFAVGFVQVARGAEVAEGTISKLAVAVATKLGAAVRAIGALFLTSGPWGWVILGVAAAVAGFIVAYKTSETFRNIVNGALRDVGAAALWLWKTALIPAFNAIKVAIAAVGTAATWLWVNAVHPAFNAMASFVTWWWKNVTLPILTALVNFVRQVVAPAIAWLWTNVVRPYFTSMSAFISAAWTGSIRPTMQALVTFFQRVVAPVILWLWRNVVVPYFTGMGNTIRLAVAGITTIINGLNNFLRRIVGPTIAWLFNNIVKPYFTSMGSAIAFVWSRVISPTFNNLKNGLTTLADAFRTGVAKIKTFWDGLQNAVKGPVRFVIDTIYNSGIRGFWNTVASKVGLPQLPQLKIKGINASRGAVIPGYAPGVDIVPATLSPGEAVLVPEAVRGLAKVFGTNAESAIQMLNSSFSSRVRPPSMRSTPAPTARTKGGLPAFDLGGIFGGIGSAASWVGSQIGSGASAAASFVKDKVGGVVGSLANAVRGLLSGPLHAAATPLHALINRVLPTSPWFSNVMRTGGNKLVDDVIGKIVGRDESMNAVANSGGGNALFGTRVPNVGVGVERWRALVVKALSAQGLSTGLADKVLRQMQTESGGNPNAVQGNIGDVNNRSGDLAKGFMQVIGATFRAYHWPGTSNNIFDPWANLMAALNYAKHRYGPSLSFLGQGHGYSLGGIVGQLAKGAGRRFADGGTVGGSNGFTYQWLTQALSGAGNGTDAAAAHEAAQQHAAHVAHEAHVAHLATLARRSPGAIPQQATAAAHVAAVQHAAHLAHLAHLATLAHRGAMPKRRLFDSGGILPPGVSLTMNGTGGNEYVLTAPQWNSIHTLASSAAASAAGLKQAASAERAGVQQTFNVQGSPGMDISELARHVAVEVAWQMREA